MTPREDGAIVCNGTCTDQGNTYFRLTNAGDEFMLSLFGNEPCGTLNEPSVTKNGVTLSRYFYYNGKGQLTINPPKGELVDFVIYPQMELGETATDYEKYIQPTTYTPDSNGKLEIPILRPTMSLLTNDVNANLSATYNKDIASIRKDIDDKLNVELSTKADTLKSPYGDGTMYSFYTYDGQGNPMRTEVANTISTMGNSAIARYYEATTMVDAKPKGGLYVADPLSKSCATNKDYVDKATKLFKHIITTNSVIGADGLEINLTLEIVNKTETKILPDSNYSLSDLTLFISTMKSIYGTAKIPNVTGYVTWFDFSNNTSAYNSSVAEVKIYGDTLAILIFKTYNELKLFQVNAAIGGNLDGFGWTETIIEI
jgi:hypothetical protein